MIGIVNYGSGNVKAIRNIYKRLNIDSIEVFCHSDLKKCKKIILPGVGAFDEAISNLDDSGLRCLLDEMVQNQGIPVLGICVGMQIMGSFSEEGVREGLGWIPGQVKRFDEKNISSIPKLPHMGWNGLITTASPMFKNVDCDFGFYFLHSYFFDAENKSDVIATTMYNHLFDSAINDKNIYGVQFHPEKSHNNGIQLFRNFAESS